MMDNTQAVRLTSLAHGGGCGCKLDPAVLTDILGAPSGFPMPKDLLVDAATRDDAAVWRINDETALVATTDFFTPIVDDPFDFGRIAATNALSDVYAMGATPIFCLAIVGMPVNALPRETVRLILEGGRAVAEAAGAPVAGGHSIDAAEPIYGLVALGLVHPDRLLANARAKAGDVLILGKPLGIGIYSAALKRGELSEDAYAQMIASTTRLNTPGAALSGMAGVHAATDVTGFGLLGHLAEMAQGSGLKARIDWDRVPVFDAARQLAGEGIKTGASGRNWAAVADSATLAPRLGDAERALLCDPQTSGGLLVSCTPDSADAVLEVFRQHGHADATMIGVMEAGPAGVSVD
ncbi:selenide, water dikinase SelD [Maricaulis virginensis]|uniref:Selenide, water dikinase n=1 Tax=Maricaulis virginensis TaxID=144022 RepID=A0A9W6IKR8_9PROT|nr:selenide, water dikinase SelD [Maricaulis virginensis]GLK50781.1 selenide, water dikinase [Maricaulis virginensis]